jgi:hypothetical protein
MTAPILNSIAQLRTAQIRAALDTLARVCPRYVLALTLPECHDGTPCVVVLDSLRTDDAGEAARFSLAACYVGPEKSRLSVRVRTEAGGYEERGQRIGDAVLLAAGGCAMTAILDVITAGA